MIIDRQLHKLFQDLKKEKAISFNYAGIPIMMRVFDEGAKLALSASVYEGGNYIPKSVRSCLSLKSPFPTASIKTHLIIDEEKYQISLNYLGSLNHLNDTKFYHLLEEFNDLVGAWRFMLDEHDRNDLVHVTAKWHHKHKGATMMWRLFFVNEELVWA